jgi:GT2 family glycosyltransferase
MAEHIAGAVAPPAEPYDADVVILALERTEETVAAIRSALEQRGVTRHVFVVDQGSRPETLTRLAAAVDGCADATLVTLRRNQGVPGGRNRGSALGHGRVIFGLDNDAAFSGPDTLARAVAALDADPKLAAVGCRILVHATGEDDRSSWGYPPALLPRAGERFDTVTFVGAGHAIRRAAWQDAGGYDEALFFCWEEYDFCLRAIGLGWRVRYCGDVVVRHKVSPEQRMAWSGQRWFHFVRNRLYIERKYGAGWLALLPRCGGYLLKGLRNGALCQTVRAVPAAMRLSGPGGGAPLPPAARAYLQRNDRERRGSWLSRLRCELFAGLPRPD